MTYSIFVSCPKNMEYLLEQELLDFGVEVDRVSPRGVYGSATLPILYRACLGSRLANRVNLVLFEADVPDIADFRQACREFKWDAVFDVSRTLSVEFHGEAAYINNTMFGGLLIKDGVVDYFNSKFNRRPNIDKQNPDIRLHGYLKKQRLTVSLDLVGYSLHQRGYRLAAGGAPLKENVAAGVLLRAGWPSLAQTGAALVDPFCGSGTLLIEGVLMATETAPGLFRDDQRVVHWLGHQPSVWQSERERAQSRCKPLRNRVVGFDVDPRAIAAARDNLERAGLSDVIELKQQSIVHFKAVTDTPGLLIANPPYGERLKDPLTLLPLYQALGEALFHHCPRWRAGILTSNALLAQAVGLKVSKQYHFYNGRLPASLYCIDLEPDNRLAGPANARLSDEASALKNRLIKNQKHLAKWLKRTGYECYRLYDADLPNYAFAIDVYQDWVHVQEYKPPKDIPVKKAQKRLIDVMNILPQVLGISESKMVLKQRQRQRGTDQYNVVDRQRRTLSVSEGAARFKVNLHDYLDTGLFLDHRPLRQRFIDTMQGKRLLNCFCYTASFSVTAALGGATTCNVDLSKTYLQWAKDNFKLNRIDDRRHEFVRADCLKWLRGCQQRFDVILLDPPTFSNSKSMEGTLDVQRDHDAMVHSAMALLQPGGTLYFSNNLNGFKLSPLLRERFSVKDITRQTIDEDFKRHKAPHCCFEITNP